MKIAIRGHESRGKEVIQILESLGGINSYKHTGDNPVIYYELHGHSIIGMCTKSAKYKYYTLEEFEKEFPFKIGDKVMDCSDNEIGTITDLIYIDNGFFYNVDFVNSGQAFMPSKQLKPYKEMKEERNITLTLEKAKEWYKRGGELKEVALQAYSEEELNSLPRSWEEFAENCARMGYYISSDGKPLMCASSGKLSSPHVCPSKKSAEAHLAMIQLEQLRNCWRQGWKPTDNDTGYCIIKYPNNYYIMSFNFISFLSFPTKKMAEEFFKCFRDLIETAGDLI